jgi:hypothetical protein
MVKLIKLSLNVVMTNKRKMLVHGTTLEPKRYTASCSDLSSGHTDINAVGGQTEPKSLDKLSVGNVVNP